MNAVPIEATNAITPVTQVSVRCPRQDAIQNWPHRCRTMNTKNSSTLHRCSEFTNRPRLDTCHHEAPPSASQAPVASTTSSAAMVVTPNT